MTGYVTISCLMYLEAEVWLWNPKSGTAGQETLSINLALVTAAKVSGLWQFGCVVSWLFFILMSALWAPICCQFLIAIQSLELDQAWVETGESAHSLVCLPSRIWACLRDCGGCLCCLAWCLTYCKLSTNTQAFPFSTIESTGDWRVFQVQSKIFLDVQLPLDCP